MGSRSKRPKPAATPSFGQWKKTGRKLGSGGNGEVLEVVGPNGEHCALKLLKRGDDRYRIARFKNEIQFLLNHTNFPGVLPLIDQSLPDSGEPLWYVMPLATPLRKHLGADPDPHTVISAFAAFADTLTRLVDEGVGHRDIKPDNLFVSDGIWLIGDFGLVTYPDSDPLTRHGRRLGPIDFLAPEMRRSPDTANPENADVYSLAKSLWTFLADEEVPLPGPHRSDDVICSLLNRISFTWTKELDLLIERCTNNDPTKRPRMAAMRDELHQMGRVPEDWDPTTNTDQLEREIARITARDIHRQNSKETLMQRNGALANEMGQALNSLAGEFIQRLHSFQATQGGDLSGVSLIQATGTDVSGIHPSWKFTIPGRSRPYISLGVSTSLRNFDDGTSAIAGFIHVKPDGSNPEDTDRIYERVAEGIAGSASLQLAAREIAAEMTARVPAALDAVLRSLRQDESL